jgi:leucine dehydrogenase
MTHRHHDVFKQAEKLGFGELHFKMDRDLELFAIVAIHQLTRGPAIGGCRWIAYPSISDAIEDALRLARGMTFKAAISNLPHGGAKAVLIRPTQVKNYEKYFETYAKFINELGGNYITAVDSGTTQKDMDEIAKHSPHVTATSSIGNPAIFTARGVVRGIEAAIKFKLDKNTLEGVHLAIQGVGNVGYLVAKYCYERGARLTVSDIQTTQALRCVKEFHAEIVSSEVIHTVRSDVFVPCALGGTLNHHTISQIHSPIIAGSANNQLAEPHDGHLLHRLGILYAPDYVINAGGLIHASGKYSAIPDNLIEKKIDGIYDTLMTIFERSHHYRKATSDIADALALEILERTPTPWQ